MKRASRRFPWVSSIVASALALFAASAQAAIPASERAALLAFYASTNGNSWYTNQGWNGPPGTECTWYGITCDSGGNFVTGISLRNQLTGSLPGNLNNLTHLIDFDVQSNQLTGPIPSLTGLTSLYNFYVAYNKLTGPIPALDGLTALVIFRAEANQLSGPIPALAGLTNLAEFHAGGNQLSGSIPALAGLSKLYAFDVDNNELTGPIPVLNGLPNLTFFAAYQNQLTGPIPALAGLSNLYAFEVDTNELSGSIPALAGLLKLRVFYAHHNQLTGSIPSLAGLVSLEDFRINDNQLSGKIPSLAGLTNLYEFFVEGNQLTGNVPSVPPPIPSARLIAGLCPNLLNHTPDPAWDAATFQSPWYTYCVALPANGNLQGLWWVPGGAESGWGINFAHQADEVFATWYTYDTNGKAWWLSMLAPSNTPTGNRFAGTIYVDSGPPFNNYVGAGAPTEVGNGTLTFSDANNGAFEYVVNGTHQLKSITRYDLGTGPQPTCTYSATTPNFAAATNYQDLWWVANGAESGWGVNLAHQGNSAFATWYTYNADHTPLWLSALVQRQGAGSVYTGPIYQNSGPRFDAYDTKKVVTNPVGTATFTFANGNAATFGYTVTVAPFPGPITQSKQITRFPFAPAGGTVCN